MKNDIALIGIITAMLFLVGSAHATIWYVHPDSVLNTIQAGIDSCSNGDTVLVGAGIYYENIIWSKMQGIHLISEFGNDTTIIDGFGTGTVIKIDSCPHVDSTTKISGFTIRNGLGGGIHCSGVYPNEVSPVISNNIIINNSAGYGGGIYCYYGSPTISQNEIINNTAANGGGICCWVETHPKIIDNIIINNSAGDLGGGISTTNSEPEITGNTIVSNLADLGGGGMFFYKTFVAISYNTISNNTAGGYGGDGMHFYQASGDVNYNNIFDNGYGVFSDFIGGSINAEYNWWGDSTGPYHDTINPGGLGDSVSDYVDFTPWLFAPWGIEEHQTPNPKSQIPIIKVFPNPFRNKIDIRFQMEDDRCKMGNFSLKIYDASGRLVKSFSLSTFNFSLPFSVVWDGRDNAGKDLPSGVYFIKFKTEQLSETRKLLLIR